MILYTIEVNKPKGPRWIPGIFYNLNPTNFLYAAVLDYEVFILTKEEVVNIFQVLLDNLDKKESITFFAAERFDQ